MTSYIEYPLENGDTILVEVEETGRMVRAARGDEPISSKMDFKKAFTSVKASIREVIAEFDDLLIEEAEIKFGIKATGEAGIFAISKVGGEMNYEVTLKWRKSEASKRLD